MMKHLIITLLACSLYAISFSQAKIEEGILTSKQTMKSDNEQAQAQMAMIGDITTTTYIKNKNSRSESSSPMTGDAVVIIDGAENKMLMLMDNPAIGKVYMEQDLNLTEDAKANLEVKKGDQTKTILGYECQQYLAKTTQRGVEVDMELYTTEKIEAYSQNSAEFGDLVEGFPLQVILTMNVPQMGGKMTITNEVTKIVAESISDDKFKMTIPEGYKEMPQQ